MYSDLIENEETLHLRTFNACQTFCKCNSPQTSYPGALIQVEVILSICYELWLDKQYELKSY
jgi:hypothetical protein